MSGLSENGHRLGDLACVAPSLDHLVGAREQCVYRKSDSAVLMMKAAEDRPGCDDTEMLNRPMEWVSLPKSLSI